MKTLTKLAMMAAVAATALSTQAIPSASVRLSDNNGATWTTIYDNNFMAGTALDANASAGVVTYSGTIGVWTVSFATGTSIPVSGGTASSPVLDLASFSASSAGGGTLILEFSDTDFGPSTGSHIEAFLSGSIAVGTGSTGGSAAFTTYANASNALFDKSGGALTTIALASPGGFGMDSGGVLGVGPYSLTERVVLTHNTAGSSSLDAHLTVVPDGGTTLMLLGSGVTALGLIRRRYFRA